MVFPLSQPPLTRGVSCRSIQRCVRRPASPRSFWEARRYEIETADPAAGGRLHAAAEAVSQRCVCRRLA